jgi:hypothetical protein
MKERSITCSFWSAIGLWLNGYTAGSRPIRISLLTKVKGRPIASVLGESWRCCKAAASRSRADTLS